MDWQRYIYRRNGGLVAIVFILVIWFFVMLLTGCADPTGVFEPECGPENMSYGDLYDVQADTLYENVVEVGAKVCKSRVFILP